MLNQSLRAPFGGSAFIFYSPLQTKQTSIPFFLSPVRAGFPSPAEDYIDSPLDLHELLIPHPASTFFVKAQGESMRDAGISSGDILIVDKSINPHDGHIAVCFVTDGFTVKRLNVQKNGTVQLLAENPDIPPIVIKGEEELRVLGVVTSIIKRIL